MGGVNPETVKNIAGCNINVYIYGMELRVKNAEVAWKSC